MGSFALGFTRGYLKKNGWWKVAVHSDRTLVLEFIFGKSLVGSSNNLSSVYVGSISKDLTVFCWEMGT